MGKVISASLHSLNTSHQLVVNYYFIEFRTIQNHRLVEIGRDLWRWSGPISKDGDSTAFLFLLWVSLTVKKKFPRQFQFVATASAPLTGQHRKKSWLCPLCTLPSGDSPEPSQQSWERCQGQIPAGCSYPPACPSCVWKSWITFPMDLGEADWPIVPSVLLAHTEDGSDFCFPSGTSASCPDQSVSRVALQWHLPAPSAFMDTSHQSPWTHMCPICLSIPWPDPLPPRLHLLCYSLSLCSQGPGIPESWSSL